MAWLEGAHRERTVRKGGLIRGRAPHSGSAAPPLLIRHWEATVRVRLCLAEPKVFFLSSEADPLPCPPPVGKWAYFFEDRMSRPFSVCLGANV